MSNSSSSGRDTLGVRQLRAIAENLFTLANQHREHHNYLVAEALYSRAMSVAQRVETVDNGECALVNRIRAEQMLLLKHGSEEKAA